MSDVSTLTILSSLQGVGARQYDAWDLGMVSSDDFTNADVRYEQSFANIRKSLTRTNGGPQEIPIVTGFLARGETTGMQTLPHIASSMCEHTTSYQGGSITFCLASHL